ncbi:hypothetical protein ACHAPU_004730 [Fusarium lateritium]
MGLPLFVAPVESDLPSKAAEKSSATSPPRSSIRRYARIDSRRRLLSLRDRIADGSIRESASLTGRDGRPVPWAEAGFPPDVETTRGPDGQRRPRPFREVLSEMTRTDDRSRELLEEQINSLFRDGSSSQVRVTWNTPPNEQEEQWDSVQGVGEPRRSTRAVMDRATVSRQAPETNEAQPRRSHPSVLQASIHRPLSEPDEGIQRHSLHRPDAERYANYRATRARILNSQRSRGVDGLGDRDRSLSPEGWDTLLATLTPDPQPPSAGSSFASNVASQTTGATSSTSFTAPDPVQDATVDQACESGCEGSDTETPDHIQPALDRIRRRREEMRRVRVRVPLMGIASVFGDLGSQESQDGGAVGPDSRRRRSPDGPVTSGVGSTDLDRASRHRQIRDRFRRSGTAWVGHMSVGNSDDEQGPDRTTRNREGSATSGNNTHAGDEDWLGMLRIVRSLARREDIPEEWWTEAGLSRTLPGDGTE